MEPEHQKLSVKRDQCANSPSTGMAEEAGLRNQDLRSGLGMLSRPCAFEEMGTGSAEESLEFCWFNPLKLFKNNISCT